jgi:hypothetical protein
MAAVDLSQSAQRERKAQEAQQALVNDEALPEVIEAEYAFMIYRKPDGQLVLTNDLNVPLTVERPPTHDEVYSAFDIMRKDMVVQQTAATSAQAVLQMQQALMQQIQGSSEFDKIREQLAREGKTGL